MAADSSPADAAGYVRFRATRWQATVILAAPLAIVAEQAFFYLWISPQHRPGLTAFAFWPVIGPLMTIGFAVNARWFGATLTPDGVLVHNIRRRSIAWHDLAVIRVEPFMLSRTVVLYERGGQRTRLRVPITGFMYRDPEFDAKVRLIRDYWTRRMPGTIAPA